MGAILASAPAAQAEGGCGPAFHRGPYGRCRPNLGPGPVVVGPRIGYYYPGRGWWHGGRYWGDRYAWHGGWRYR